MFLLLLLSTVAALWGTTEVIFTSVNSSASCFEVETPLLISWKIYRRHNPVGIGDKPDRVVYMVPPPPPPPLSVFPSTFRSCS